MRKGERRSAGCALIYAMSAMNDGGYTVELKGKKYRLLFTLNALEELQDKCGGYDKLPEVFNQNNKDWVKDTKWLLTMLINEGLLEEDENAELLSEDKVGRLIHLGNIREVQNAIFASFAAGTAGDGNEDEEENGESETGEVAAVQEN